ncbi:hypothetical protein QQZ08_005306 [Neonectria magnoliae]|uniref:AB hydrolase-1 domain-containing protein n=1 Tax=Neonectria magnoliae TaxID=2732573 RepID=A0ABR1I5F6_9HYPO
MVSILNLPDSRALSYSLDASPKDGPMVILSNSLATSFGIWDHVVKALNRDGFRTLRYDPPGHGRSSAPAALDTTFDSMADDVNTLLKSLDITKVHAWIGVSMGAAGGVYFTTKYPGIVSKLAICDTMSASPVNVGVEDLFGARVAAARDTGSLDPTIRGTVERWLGKDWIDMHPDEAERVRHNMAGTTIDGFETCCHALRSDTFDLRPLLGKVGAAVDDALLVVGEKDANLPDAMADMRDKIEQGFRAAGKENSIRLVIINEAGHLCFIDGLQQFASAVLGWVKAEQGESTSG